MEAKTMNLPLQSYSYMFTSINAYKSLILYWKVVQEHFKKFPTILSNLKQLPFHIVASKVSSDANGGTHKKSSLVVCFGEMLIDFVPTVGGVSLSEAPAFKKAPGGAPANVAVGISRLGGLSAFIGKVMKKICSHYLLPR